MVENLLFSLNRVMPYFFLILMGIFFRQSKMVPERFFEDANRFTFRVALPVQLFMNVLEIDRSQKGNSVFLFFVFLVTMISFLLIWLVTELLYKDKSLVGTLVQGGFRGNFVLLGLPLAGSVLGQHAAQTAALTSAVVIPTYNILAVFILMVRGTNGRRYTPAEILKGAITNPLLIGICCAIPLTLLGVKLPFMVSQTLSYVGQTATPLGLLSIGGMLKLSDVTARLRPSLYASAIKNLLLPAAAMTASYLLGFRGEELLILLVLTASPVAVSSYVMATEMGGDGPIASNILILTTFVSAFVLAAGIYLLRSMRLI